MIESIFFNPWIWILAIILAILLIATVVFAIAATRSTWDGDVYAIGAFTSGLLAVLVAVPYFAWLLPPYDASFYQTYRITGEVSQLESAFSGDEGTMSQVFIAKVDGIDLFIKSDDQRFRTIAVGDDVNLVCGKSFAYFQEPWFDCSFGSN